MATTERKIKAGMIAFADNGTTGKGHVLKVVETFTRPGRFRLKKIDAVACSKTDVSPKIAYDVCLAVMFVPEGTRPSTANNYLWWGQALFSDLIIGTKTEDCVWWGQMSWTPRDTANISGYTSFGIPGGRMTSEGEKFRWINYQSGDKVEIWETCTASDRTDGQYLLVIDYEC